MKYTGWSEMQAQAAEVAVFGKARIDGKVAYLATVRANGLPRSHPVTPIVGEGCFIFADAESRKVRDFRANPYYSLHCGMSDSSGSSGEFQIAGQAVEVDSREVREKVEAICNFRPSPRALLFELKLSEAIATEYRGGRPERKRWFMES